MTTARSTCSPSGRESAGVHCVARCLLVHSTRIRQADQLDTRNLFGKNFDSAETKFSWLDKPNLFGMTMTRKPSIIYCYIMIDSLNIELVVSKRIVAWF